MNSTEALEKLREISKGAKTSIAYEDSIEYQQMIEAFEILDKEMMRFDMPDQWFLKGG